MSKHKDPLRTYHKIVVKVARRSKKKGKSYADCLKKRDVKKAVKAYPNIAGIYFLEGDRVKIGGIDITPVKERLRQLIDSRNLLDLDVKRAERDGNNTLADRLDMRAGIIEEEIADLERELKALKKK